MVWKTHSVVRRKKTQSKTYINFIVIVTVYCFNELTFNAHSMQNLTIAIDKGGEEECKELSGTSQLSKSTLKIKTLNRQNIV